jgi:O-antigen/teichoic acid export membrane protein
MKPTDPQFLYLILVLPALIGLALVGDGINRILHEEGSGYLSLILGLVFFAIVILAYFFFSTYLVQTQ